MTNTSLSEDDLIGIADQLKRQRPDMAPLELLTALSARVLAHHIPEKGDALVAGDCDKVAQTFALEMLRLNDKPASMWLGEDRQQKSYGGIEALLFGSLPEGIFEHYAKLLGRSEPASDPLFDD